MHVDPTVSSGVSVRIVSVPSGVSVPRVRRAAALALAALACAVLMSACGSSASSSSGSSTSSASGSTTKIDLNTTRVAHSIEQSILAERHLASTVVCPSGVPQEAGRTFECVASTASAKKPGTLVKTPFVVTIQNKNGYVTYAGK
jgi:hypothetical protein